MRRRDFIAFVGGSVLAWPLGAGAQQTTTPVVGFVSSLSAKDATHIIGAFHLGLKEAGYRLGLVTNSWPFPVRALLAWTGLDQLFEHVIASSEVGLAKQDGPEIYFLAAQMFGVLPEECVMATGSSAWCR